MMLVFPDQRLSMKISPVGSMFFFLPASLISSTYTDKNSPLARSTNNILNLKLFPDRVPVEFFQIAFPRIVLPEDDRTDSFREERLDLPWWTMILATCVVVDVVQMSGHSDFGIFNNDGGHLPF